MAEGNRPVTRIPSIFDSDDSDEGPPPTTFQPLTTKTHQREKQEELPVPADNLSSNSEDSDDPSLSLRLSNKTPTEGEEDLTGGLPEEASTSEDTGSLETEDANEDDADAKEMESANLETDDALERNDNDDDNQDEDHDDVYQEDNNVESRNFVHLGVGNADDLSNDEQNTSDDSEDAGQPGDSSSSLVDDDMESQNEGESMAKYPQNSEFGQVDGRMPISKDQESPMDTDDKGGGPKEESLQESGSAEKDEELMEVMEEKSEDSKIDAKEECKENEGEMAKLVRIKSEDDQQGDANKIDVAKGGSSAELAELEDDLSEVQKGEGSTSTTANDKSSSSSISTIKNVAEMKCEDEVFNPSDSSIVKENEERPVNEKTKNPDKGVRSGVATPESESSTTTANDGLKKTNEEDECRTDVKRESVKDIFSSDEENSTDIGLKIALSEEDVEMKSAPGNSGVGDEVQSHNRAEAKNTSSPSSSHPGKELTDADEVC